MELLLSEHAKTGAFQCNAIWYAAKSNSEKLTARVLCNGVGTKMGVALFVGVTLT